MKKPHVVPLAQYFLKSQYRATHCVDEHFYVHFDAHSVSFKPVMWSVNAPETINNILHKFADVLRISNEKHFNRLSLHFYECQGLETVILSRLGSELARHFRNLRELTLFLFSCDQIKEKGIQKFLSLISKSLKNLKTLNISVLGYTKLDEKGESYIRRLCMNRLKNLQKLNLVFSGEQADILEEHLPYETNLKKHILKRSLLDWMMKYSNPDPISSEATISLYYTVRQFSRNLQHLTLAFPDLTLDSQSLNRLSSVLRCFKSLKTLFLGLNYGEALENDELGEELSCSLRGLSSLQSLTLRFGTVNFITTGFLTKMSGFLSHLHHLREFGLSFVSELMKDKDFCSLVTQICLGAKNLEFLTLCFDQIGDVSNQAITQAIQDICYHLSCLKGLIFNCLYSTSSNKDAPQIIPKQIVQQLTQLHLYLPNSKFELDLSNCCESLSELTLSLNDCRQMTNFSKLLTHISSLNFKSIDCLTLLFNQARFLNDETFKTLSSLDWTSLANLKHLSLGFLGAKNITDTALDYTRLCILEHFTGLSTLEMLFKHCDSITENGIKLLCMTIVRHMTHLKSLVIDFSYISVSKIITETIVNKIAVSFKELEKLRLKFTNDNHYDAVFMSEMRKKLWSIREVDFYYCPPRIHVY